MMDAESPMKVVKREENEADAREGSFRRSHTCPFGTGAFEKKGMYVSPHSTFFLLG